MSQGVQLELKLSTVHTIVWAPKDEEDCCVCGGANYGTYCEIHKPHKRRQRRQRRHRRLRRR